MTDVITSQKFDISPWIALCTNFLQHTDNISLPEDFRLYTTIVFSEL
jgi:hypothetical protein